MAFTRAELHRPLAKAKEGHPELRTDCSTARFKAIAAGFHSEFFSEHPDNVVYTNLVKCLLAKIFDERDGTGPRMRYAFQVKVGAGGREEPAQDVADRVNDLYRRAFTRYIDPAATVPDEIDYREFPQERVKTVVKALEGLSLTRGAALHGDVIGAFFEEVLQAGFKQDKGMYFTHANLVWFMLEALDIRGLTMRTWRRAARPEDRLPHIIDPSCGSGAFLLRAMQLVTKTVRESRAELTTSPAAARFLDEYFPAGDPNRWAEHFLYGIDPKFIMAITAKVNMVLHGGGGAHVFKHDGLAPLATYRDARLRPASPVPRSVDRAGYQPDVAEGFDVVVSNPPFGITLSKATRATIAANYTIRDSASSEALFVERWFQLLKPGGRLGVVVPESLLNGGDYVDVRLFLYRCFWLRAIVSLPRNLFVDTPTLTSLLFAQRKTAGEIAEWDGEWAAAQATIAQEIADFEHWAARARAAAAQPAAAQPGGDLPAAAQSGGDLPASDVQREFFARLPSVVDPDAFVLRRGRGRSAPVVLPARLPTAVSTAAAALDHYAAFLGAPGTHVLRRNAAFRLVADKLDYDFGAYVVDEVGFKLSKRRERVRPNQLCRFQRTGDGHEAPNLHLVDGEVEVVIDTSSPSRVLDFIRRDIGWT